MILEISFDSSTIPTVQTNELISFENDQNYSGPGQICIHLLIELLICLEKCLFVASALLKSNWENLLHEARNFLAEVTVAVTDTEEVSVRSFFKIWMQNKTVLVLFTWVTWHETNPRRKGILCYYILHFVLVRDFNCVQRLLNRW